MVKGLGFGTLLLVMAGIAASTASIVLLLPGEESDTNAAPAKS